MLVRESSLATAYPVVTQYDIGTDPNQVPLNGLLGTMAFQDSAGVNFGTASIGQIVGPVSIDLGTVAAPTISFTGDSNTGIYSPGADQFAIATNGVQRILVSSAGEITFKRSNDTNGYVTFDGVDNTYISTLATNARFSTVANFIYTINSTERLRFTSNGIELTAGNIKFPATQVASADPNTLDDYEEGTWTAAITATNGGSQTYTMTASTASYTKIGNVVHLFGRLEWTYSAGGSPSNNCAINLPFSAGSTSYQYRSNSFVGTSNTAGVLLSRETATSASFFSNMSGGAAFFNFTYMIGP